MKENLNFLFEIPVKIMERAIRFYESVFNIKLARQEIKYPTGNVEMACFPETMEQTGSGGALIHQSDKDKTGDILVFLNSREQDIDQELARVEKEGGVIITPKTFVSKIVGYIATFIDSEGNKVSLISKK
ncbi:VOC family protein [Pseudoflavitalea sp. G-6-1-2]|uniref:VOC family protein n=1 Tax=Pseudoflavitalea sp. G-6-1-2 TaxID=2728841 RepID=UPI00146F596F|nr:VOC family protein [Pseudoflavitalea sp. G-6-1-2]NML23809.1 VOC family protein [Pseudoflavitalea sp. G-6-1-2]